MDSRRPPAELKVVIGLCTKYFRSTIYAVGSFWPRVLSDGIGLHCEFRFSFAHAMVSNTLWQHGAYIGVILYKQNLMCTQMGHHFSYLIWATIWRMNPLFTSVIFDNLLTKHSTHMAYISKPLVRKFRIL